MTILKKYCENEKDLTRNEIESVDSRGENCIHIEYEDYE